MSQGGLQNIELAADSQRVSERLYNLLAVGEGGRCLKSVQSRRFRDVRDRSGVQNTSFTVAPHFFSISLKASARVNP